MVYSVRMANLNFEQARELLHFHSAADASMLSALEPFNALSSL